MSGSVHPTVELSAAEGILNMGTTMPGEYVEQRNGGYYVQGTRVSLDSVVYAFLRGESSDGIAESFPALRLEQVTER